MNFAERLIIWQKKYGRHHLPWQVNDPYKIWISEIMLQQTQVESVKPYYLRFLDLFPTLMDLHHAPLEKVLAAWAGLGYYARAKNIKKTAKIIAEDFNGQFPNQLKDLESLPGIGKSTAAALFVFAFNQKAAILDGNVKRVFARYFLIKEAINQKETENKLWAIAQKMLPEKNIQIYTQGLMDLGALICTPKGAKCLECPQHKDCLAYLNNLVETLPQKQKIKKENKNLEWFILFFQNEVYLEKKPLKGIWGGLLTPLENLTLDQNFILKESVLNKINHHLTHRVLTISPKIIFLKEKPLTLKGEWILLENLFNKEMPAPLFKLFKNYFKNLPLFPR